MLAGAAMRTAPFPPYPLFVLPMPDGAALALARALHARGEEVGGANGALPGARVFADEIARLTGGYASVHEHIRLFELGDLVEPAAGARAGCGRPTRADVDAGAGLVRGVRRRRRRAGRPDRRGPTSWSTIDEDACAERIAAGRVWLWEDEDRRAGAPDRASTRRPSGSRGSGPSTRRAAHRGHGYASAAVAEVSRRLLDEGARVCLFTDQANPTSNRIYQALGYAPVVDMANFLIAPGPPP